MHNFTSRALSIAEDRSPEIAGIVSEIQNICKMITMLGCEVNV